MPGAARWLMSTAAAHLCTCADSGCLPARSPSTQLGDLVDLALVSAGFIDGALDLGHTHFLPPAAPHSWATWWDWPRRCCRPSPTPRRPCCRMCRFRPPLRRQVRGRGMLRYRRGVAGGRLLTACCAAMNGKLGLGVAAGRQCHTAKCLLIMYSAASRPRAGEEEAAGGAAASEKCQREAFLKQNPALLQKFTADLLPLMIKVGRRGWQHAAPAGAWSGLIGLIPCPPAAKSTPASLLAAQRLVTSLGAQLLPHGCAPQVYSSSVTPQVKRQCLTTLAKMLHFNSADTLAGEWRVGSHVAGWGSTCRARRCCGGCAWPGMPRVCPPSLTDADQCVLCDLPTPCSPTGGPAQFVTHHHTELLRCLWTHQPLLCPPPLLPPCSPVGGPAHLLARRRPAGRPRLDCGRLRHAGGGHAQTQLCGTPLACLLVVKWHVGGSTCATYSGACSGVQLARWWQNPPTLLLRARAPHFLRVLSLVLQMAEALMEKLPDIFSQFFLKEGVVHAVDQLAAVQPSPPPPEASKSAAAAAADKGKARRSGGGERPASRAADKDGGASEGGDMRTPAGDTLRLAVGARARRFNARYFTDSSGRTVGERSGRAHGLAGMGQRKGLMGVAGLRELQHHAVGACAVSRHPPLPSATNPTPPVQAVRRRAPACCATSAPACPTQTPFPLCLRRWRAPATPRSPPLSCCPAAACVRSRPTCRCAVAGCGRCQTAHARTWIPGYCICCPALSLGLCGALACWR